MKGLRNGPSKSRFAAKSRVRYVLCERPCEVFDVMWGIFIILLLVFGDEFLFWFCRTYTSLAMST